MDLIRSLTWVSAAHLRLVRDDDSHVDRLSHRYTVAICLLFSVIVTTKQYAGDPIDCWVPAQFKASYEKYADSYCWIAGSWYTPMDKELPLNERERRQNRIRYYQWVPFLLLFQAILCYIPRIIWRTLNVKSGLDIVNLVDAAIKYESVDKFSDREKIMAYIIRNIERYIGARKSRYERLYGRKFCLTHKAPSNIATVGHNNNQIKNLNINETKNSSKRKISFGSVFKSCCLNLRIVLSTICFWTGKRLGNYLVVLYMFVKTLWLTNAVSQLFLLNSFIGNNYHLFGIEIIQMLLSGQEWHELRHFPRVTYCDFKIREIGNAHDWTVQCVLRINLFNEVIYIFMWFWLCILAVFTAIDYVTWGFRIFIPVDKLRFIKRHLDIYNCNLPMNNNKINVKKMTKNDPNINDIPIQHTAEYQANLDILDINKEKKLIREFTFNYLKDDVIFAMRILSSSASDLIVTEIISELWKNFKINTTADQHVEEITFLTTPSGSSSSSSSSASSNASNSLDSSSSSHSSSAPSPSNEPNHHFKRHPSSSSSIKKNFNYTNNSLQKQHVNNNNHYHHENYPLMNQADDKTTKCFPIATPSNAHLNNTNNTNTNNSNEASPLPFQPPVFKSVSQTTTTITTQQQSIPTFNALPQLITTNNNNSNRDQLTSSFNPTNLHQRNTSSFLDNNNNSNNGNINAKNANAKDTHV